MARSSVCAPIGDNWRATKLASSQSREADSSRSVTVFGRDDCIRRIRRDPAEAESPSTPRADVRFYHGAHAAMLRPARAKPIMPDRIHHRALRYRTPQSATSRTKTTIRTVTKTPVTAVFTTPLRVSIS